jgi:hypothetical protein
MSENRVVVRNNVKGWEAFEVVIRDYEDLCVFCKGCYWLGLTAAVEYLKPGEWKVRIVMGKREKLLTAQAAAFIERVVNLLESKHIRCDEAMSYQWTIYDNEHQFIMEDNTYSVSLYWAGKNGRHLEDHTRTKSRIRILAEVIGRLETFNVISY